MICWLYFKTEGSWTFIYTVIAYKYKWILLICYCFHVCISAEAGKHYCIHFVCPSVHNWDPLATASQLPGQPWANKPSPTVCKMGRECRSHKTHLGPHLSPERMAQTTAASAVLWLSPGMEQVGRRWDGHPGPETHPHVHFLVCLLVLIPISLHLPFCVPCV